MNSLKRVQAKEAVEAFSKLEAEIREVGRAMPPQVAQEDYNELAASNIGSLLQHVSGTSVQEIEKLIAELQILRDMLQKEAARVQREIVGYAVLIQNARRSINTISESLSFWQNDRDESPRISA
jgi:hypothetical protein